MKYGLNMFSKMQTKLTSNGDRLTSCCDFSSQFLDSNTFFVIFSNKFFVHSKQQRENPKNMLFVFKNRHLKVRRRKWIYYAY